MGKRLKFQILTIEQVKQIALEYGREKGPARLAEEFNVSKQRVQQVAMRLRKEGVLIPYMRITRYKEITKELKKEHPELFEGGEKHAKSL